MDAALSELEAVGVTDTPGVLVADTGYWHQIQMDQIVEHGTHVLISRGTAGAGRVRSARSARCGSALRRVRTSATSSARTCMSA